MTIPRFRRIAVTALAVACASTVAACGSSAHSSTSAGSGSATSGSGGASRVGFKLTATQQACLKKHGVTFGFGGHRPGGTPPTGANAKRPKNVKRGSFPHGADSSRFAAQFAKRRAAMTACGITFPTGGRGGPGGGAPPAG